MKSRWSCIVFAMSVCSFASPSFQAGAQEAKDITVEGQVKIGVHKFTLDKSSLYQLEVKGKDFTPQISLLGFYIPNTVPFGKEQNTFRGVFFPPKGGEYTLAVLPNLGFSPKEGLLDYTVTLKAMMLDESPLLKKEDKLTDEDPKYANPGAFNKTHFKAYPLKMKAGRTYIIDMVRAQVDGNKIDPYLFIEGSDKNILARDDDGGGFPNARIIFQAMKDGDYHIIASGLSDFSGIGEYILTVRTVKKAK